MTDDLIEVRGASFSGPPHEVAREEAPYREPGRRFIIVRKGKQTGFWPLRWDATEWIVSHKYGPIMVRVGHAITRRGALARLHREEDDTFVLDLARETW